MKQRTISEALLKELDAKHGFQKAAPDHPAYSEGPSITFSSHTPKQSEQIAIVSPCSNPPETSANQKEQSVEIQSGLEEKMNNLDDSELDEADSDGESADQCPYCGRNDSCEHLLLSVDCTFREAVGGALYESFTTRWSNVYHENSDDENFDEREAFDDLLYTATGKSDFEWTNEFEGGPGQSSTYRSFYCKDKELVAKVVEDWQSGKG